MKIKKAKPPNYDEILLYLPVNDRSVFCYGDTIYNPSGKDLLEDLIVHEEVHSRQQGEYPDVWWYRYLTEPQFRLEQEIEAYGEQYAFAKRHIEKAAREVPPGHELAAGKTKLLKFALENMSEALSGPEYGSLITQAEAVSKIRAHAKQVL